MRHETALVVVALSAATGFLAPAPASAADMPSYYAPMGTPGAADPQLEFGTGWYLRGDAAFSSEDKPKLLLRDTNPTFSKNGSDIGYAFGGGAGYKFTDYFRADITADYLTPYRYSGSTPCGTLCAVTENTTLWRWEGLLNGYFDLGTWAGVTPYVGAGAGFAGTHEHSAVNVLYGDQLLQGPPAAGHTAYQFAWAGMAGISYAVSPHLLFDLGYRYLDLGKSTIDLGKSTPKLVPGTSVTRAITEQQVRLGIRYMVD